MKKTIIVLLIGLLFITGCDDDTVATAEKVNINDVNFPTIIITVKEKRTDGNNIFFVPVIYWSGNKYRVADDTGEEVFDYICLRKAIDDYMEYQEDTIVVKDMLRHCPAETAFLYETLTALDKAIIKLEKLIPNNGGTKDEWEVEKIDGIPVRPYRQRAEDVNSMWGVIVEQETDYLRRRWDINVAASNKTEAFDNAITEIKACGESFLEVPFKKRQAYKYGYSQ